MTDPIIRILAVLGAGAIGGLGTVIFCNVLLNLTTRQRMPSMVQRTLGLMGAIVLGGLTAKLLLTGSGWLGIGGGGEEASDNKSAGSAEVAASLQPTTTAKSERRKPTKEKALAIGESVRVEVLGPSALQRLNVQSPNWDGKSLYRIGDGGTAKVVNLTELKVLLTARMSAATKLRQVTLVLYMDSPDKEVEAVSGLTRWIDQDLSKSAADKVVVVFEEHNTELAPER